MSKIEITVPKQKSVRIFPGSFFKHRREGHLWFLFCDSDIYNFTRLETGEVYSDTGYSYEEILTLIHDKRFELLCNGTEIKITVENNNE